MIARQTRLGRQLKSRYRGHCLAEVHSRLRNIPLGPVRLGAIVSAWDRQAPRAECSVPWREPPSQRNVTGELRTETGPRSEMSRCPSDIRNMLNGKRRMSSNLQEAHCQGVCFKGSGSFASSTFLIRHRLGILCICILIRTRRS